MKRSTRIMNAELAKLITGLKHGDMVLITDAGCPTPKDIPCIDLAVTYGVPSIEMMLSLFDQEVVVEKIVYAQELRTNNPTLHGKLKKIYTDVDFEEIPHTDLVKNRLGGVKCSIRTGEFSPWGNILMVAGTDPYLWFSDETVAIPEFYTKRFKQIRSSGKDHLFDKSHYTRKD